MVSRDLDDLSAWQYDLPQELIASRPTARRDDSRLMVVRRETSAIEHYSIRDLPSLLQSGDRLVMNNTKVIPARLFGFRTSTQGKWEGLFLSEDTDGLWRITGQTRGRLKVGESLTLVPAHSQSATEPLHLLLTSRNADGTWMVRPDRPDATIQLLDEYGTLPLPPYIGRKVADQDDADRYQTVYASEQGAIAAPTAGLHFTPELLQSCQHHGISTSEVTLHVGIGTFRPVATEKLSAHEMHSEWCSVSEQTVAQINQTQQAGGKIVCVGTTTVRTLEAAAGTGTLCSMNDTTDLFIRPGYNYRVVDQLLTNFHLPGSTLIVLVAALAGYELTMEAYRRAVEQEYRFYSYGDAMLIL